MSEGAGNPEVAIQPRRRRISVVWIIPIVAILIGGWLAYTTISEKGPTITITFETAEGDGDVLRFSVEQLLLLVA